MNDKISPHFKRSEFTCGCGCGYDSVDVELIAVLEQVRHHFNAPITVNSGARCPRHNTNVGGEKHSQHLVAKAADIVVKDVEPWDVYDYLDAEYSDSLGLGKYHTWTHVDVRSTKARW